MPKYYVECTKIYNAALNVDAKSSDDAIEKARAILANDMESVDWTFGEATADYAEKL